MTNEEAIKELKKHISICMYTLDDTDEHLEAEHLAIIVLEKQIPKKPIRTETAIRIFSCPICGNLICDKRIEYEDNQYCERCGQAIDWSKDD